MEHQANISNLTSWALNNSQQALVYTLSVLDNGSYEEEVARLLAINHLTSPAILVTAVLLVFLVSPTIIIGNALVLIAIYRFKRLRTPSNYLVMSLATSDLGVGMYTPIGTYLELCGVGQSTAPSGAALCLLNYGVPITLCCVSVLVMVAIAVDRFTSLARPLRYNNLITHTAMERYIAVFWIYAALVGFSPFAYHISYGSLNYQVSNCSFSNLIPRPIQLFMFCAVYGPSAFILLVCYGYIYVVARGHARAISEVRHSLQYGHGSSAPRYGLALAITTGMFLTLWLPFQICMLLDVFTDSKILTHWVVIYLALPIVSSSAFNPWIYGYRNGELRLAVQKVVDDILTMLGFDYRSHPMAEANFVPPSIAATAGDAGSLINHQLNLPHQTHSARHPDPLMDELDDCMMRTRTNKQTPIKREYYSWNPDDEFLLVPMAQPESSGFLSLDDEKCTSAKNINLMLNNNHLNSSELNSRSLNNNHSHSENKCSKAVKKMCHRQNLNTQLNCNFVKDIKEFRELKKSRGLKEVINLNDVKDATDTKKYKDTKHNKKSDEDCKHQEVEHYWDFDFKYSRIQQGCCNRPGLKGSKSMIESFAGLRNGTDVWIFKGKNLMFNGASIV